MRKFFTSYEKKWKHYNLSLFQNALNAQRVAGLIKTAETMGILDTSSESSKQSDIDEILGFLAALEKVSDWMTFGGQVLLSK